MKKTPPTKPGALFGENAPEPKTALPAAHRFNIDGGSRGNPGPASYGVVVRDPGGKIVAELKKYIGRMTNNVAEYYGLIAALDYAESHGIRALRVEADSELLVKQMRGQYKVKSEDLQPLFERARKMAAGFHSFRIDHVYREQNRDADRLANEAMDEAEGKTAAKADGKTAASKTAAASPKTEKAKAESATAAAKTGPRLIPARYRAGVLYLLEDMGLPDGTVCKIILHSVYDPSKT
jgi:ribonuclease HI